MPPVSFLQKALLALFLALLLVPGGTLLGRRLQYGRWDGSAAGRPAVLTLDSWWSGRLQARFTKWYDDYLGQKRRLVTAYNQLLYSCFRVSHMNGGNLRVGPHDWLFEKVYLDDYFQVGPLAPEATLVRQAEAIASLQQACARKGICFLLVLTPSKPAFYPEEAPLWHRRAGIRPERNYDRFVRLLAARSVPVIDGHVLLMARRQAGPGPALFPAGGTHWNHWAASLVLEQLQARAADFFGRPLPALRRGELRTDFAPQGTDADLATLLYLVRPPLDYEVVKFPHRIEPSAGAFRPRTYWVGNSFSYTLLDLAASGRNRLFVSLDYGFYFHDFFRWDEHAALQPLPDPAASLDALTTAELVVLEINEAAIPLHDYPVRFAEEALKRLK